MLASSANKSHLAERVYWSLKSDIAEFRLTPGDRFTESQVAARLQVSRTPVREALFRLQSEGFVDVMFRSGWLVKPFSFEQFEHLYDLRMVLETTAVQRLSKQELGIDQQALTQLQRIWLLPRDERSSDGKQVSLWDEQFHQTLVAACGNPELVRVHSDVTERIRIVRRL